MTHFNDKNEVPAQWVKPELKRLSAGAAENLNVNARDGGVDPGTNQS